MQTTQDMEDDKLGNAVLRITTSHREFDWTMPFNENNSFESSGTGFVLQSVTLDRPDAFALVTAYHVVELAKQVFVRIEDDDRTSLAPATLVACNPELDVAILIVRDRMPSNVTPLRPGDSDAVRPLQRVSVLGYALGKAHLQYTDGVLSGRTHNKIQIDAAVNSGNSGGPLLLDGEVIGIVTSGYTAEQAQNTNFACALKEALMSLRSLIAEKKTFELPPSLNARFSVTPMSLLKSYGLSHGVVCTFVSETSSLFRAGMREGDILLSLDDRPVYFDLTVRLDMWGRRPLFYEVLLVRSRVGHKMKVTFLHIQKGSDAYKNTSHIQLQKNTFSFRKIYPEFEKHAYTTFGGIVVQPIVTNLLTMPMKPFTRKLIQHMAYTPLQETSLAVITHIAPDSPFRSEQTIQVGNIIESINNVRLHEAAERPYDAYASECDRLMKARADDKADDIVIIIRTREGNIACAPLSAI